MIYRLGDGSPYFIAVNDMRVPLPKPPVECSRDEVIRAINMQHSFTGVVARATGYRDEIVLSSTAPRVMFMQLPSTQNGEEFDLRE